MLGIFLDTETNGLNPQKHRILEIAYKMINLHDGECIAHYHSVVKQPPMIWESSDPKSLEINGFTKEKMIRGKEEKEVANEILHSFESHKISRKNAVFICQNPSFDRFFFSQLIDVNLQDAKNWPYHWLDLASMYWGICIYKAKNQLSPFPWETGFSKDFIASHYQLPPEKKPHLALNGVNHLILCYEAVVGFPGKKSSS